MLFPNFILALLPASLANPTPVLARSQVAPLHVPRSASSAIPGKYIVKFRDDASDFSISFVISNQKPDHIFRAPGFRGFAGSLDDASLDAIRNLPEVEFIEQDSTVTAYGKISQPGAPWGLARLSSRTPNSTTYRYDESAGAGTCVYVIDTGVYATHPELAGRVIFAMNTAGDGTNTDLNGHGTGVAGVVGGIVHGVAKKTSIIDVKVLNGNGSGTTSGVIAGFSFVTADSQTRPNCPNGTVANVSLGGSKSTAINTAAAAMVNAGIFVSVAAGGSNDDVQYYSPASEPLVFTVGASDIEDVMSWSTNYGKGLDLFAPGVDIEVPWLGGGTNVLSGNSFSAAFVSGLGAYFLGMKPRMSPGELGEYIANVATKDALSGVPVGTQNLLAHNGIHH